MIITIPISLPPPPANEVAILSINVTMDPLSKFVEFFVLLLEDSFFCLDFFIPSEGADGEGVVMDVITKPSVPVAVGSSLLAGISLASSLGTSSSSPVAVPAQSTVVQGGKAGGLTGTSEPQNLMKQKMMMI